MTQIDGLDRIERSIDNDATAEKVWALVTRPGRWINAGEVLPEADHRREEPGREVVHRAVGTALSELATELDRVGRSWEVRLARLKDLAENQ